MDRLVVLLLAIMAFGIPWEEFVSIGGAQTVVRLAGYVGISAALIAVLARASAKRLPPYLVLSGAFVVWSILSVVWSVTPEAGGICVTYVSCWLFAWMIWEFCCTDSRQSAVIHAYLLGCVVSLLMLFGDFAASRGSASFVMRYTGARMNPNQLALVFALSIILAIYLATRSTLKIRWLRLVYMGYAIVATAGVFLTGSRTGFFSLAAGVAVLFLGWGGGQWRAKLLLLLTLLATTYVIVRIVPEELRERTTQAPGQRGTESLGARIDFWKAGMKQLARHPLGGVGVAAFSDAVREDLAGLRPSAHNTWVGVLVETGPLGFALYLWSVIAVINGVRKLPPAERYPWLAALVSWVVGGMANDTNLLKYSWFALALACAHAELLQRQIRPRAVLSVAIRPPWWIRTRGKYGL